MAVVKRSDMDAAQRMVNDVDVCVVLASDCQF